ncbi:MAG: MXAN_5187 C-terminal domain-containing protein [Myxococcales bacterium]
MRSRFWLFALLVAAVLAVNLALVSARFAQSSEEALGSRLTVATGGVRTQMELIDLRSSPRIAAFNPELIEATKPDSSQQPARPDERALRAAAAALQPEPDLLVVATAHAAAVSRRGRAASLGEDPARLPLIRIALEGSASPQFVAFEGRLYRAAAARIPGNAAVVLTGTAIDDRFAAQLRSLVDADVSFLQQGAVVASTLAGDDRAALSAWAKAPAAPGFGTLRIALPGVGTRFSEYLPLGAPRAATRAAAVPLSQGVQAALSLPAAPHVIWLARYQAFYAAGWVLFILVSFIWGLAAGGARRAQAAARPAPVPMPPRATEETAVRRVAQRSEAQELGAQDAGRAAPGSSDAPWSDEVSAPVRAGRRGHEPLDPELPPLPAKDEEPQFGDLPASAGADPVWSGDPFGAPSPAQAATSGSASGEPELAREAFAAASPAEQDHEPGAEAPAALGAGWSNAPADGAAPPGGWGAGESGTAEPWPPPEPEAKPTPRPAAPARAAAEGQDPDEAHFRETFEKFMALRAETGESAALSYEKFVAKLRQNREQLLSRGTARTVRFTVYKKDGRAAIKASALR